MDETRAKEKVCHAMESDRHIPGKGAMAQVEGYWQALTLAGHLPQRKDLKPSALDGALEHVSILERIDTGIFRMRFAGRHISDLMGMEVRGMPLSALIRPGERELLSDALENVRTHHTPTRLKLRAGTLRGELLVLPLSPDDRNQDHLLACLISDEPAGLAPCRFEIRDVLVDRARPQNLGSTTTDPKAPARQPASGFAEDRAEFQSKPTRVPFLRIVDLEE
ncbi:MAG: PAS domain-containing protein [Rhodobacteraceae bacterium]|nr:PAS domain-containing protein [Paracoccaceae bacterium]